MLLELLAALAGILVGCTEQTLDRARQSAARLARLARSSIARVAFYRSASDTISAQALFSKPVGKPHVGADAHTSPTTAAPSPTIAEAEAPTASTTDVSLASSAEARGQPELNGKAVDAMGKAEEEGEAADAIGETEDYEAIDALGEADVTRPLAICTGSSPETESPVALRLSDAGGAQTAANFHPHPCHRPRACLASASLLPSPRLGECFGGYRARALASACTGTHHTRPLQVLRELTERGTHTLALALALALAPAPALALALAIVPPLYLHPPSRTCRCGDPNPNPNPNPAPAPSLVDVQVRFRPCGHCSSCASCTLLLTRQALLTKGEVLSCPLCAALVWDVEVIPTAATPLLAARQPTFQPPPGSAVPADDAGYVLSLRDFCMLMEGGGDDDDEHSALAAEVGEACEGEGEGEGEDCESRPSGTLPLLECALDGAFREACRSGDLDYARRWLQVPMHARIRLRQYLRGIPGSCPRPPHPRPEPHPALRPMRRQARCSTRGTITRASCPSTSHATAPT